MRCIQTNAGVEPADAADAFDGTERAARVEVGTVRDRGDGTYAVAYSSVRSGRYNLHVRLRPAGDRGLEATYFRDPLFRDGPMELQPRGFGGDSGLNGADAFALPVTSRVEAPPKLAQWAAPGAAGDPANYAAAYAPGTLALGGPAGLQTLASGGARAVRWVGFLSVPVTEPFTLTAKFAAGAAAGAAAGTGGSTLRVTVRGAVVIAAEAQAAEGAPGTLVSAPLAFVEGKLVPIVIEASDRTQSESRLGRRFRVRPDAFACARFWP
jgi:hypothetical protein